MTWLDEHWDEIIAMGPVRASVRVCAVVGCDRPKQALGLCTPHYTRARERFDPAYRERMLTRYAARRAGRRALSAQAEAQAETPDDDPEGPTGDTPEGTPDPGRGGP